MLAGTGFGVALSLYRSYITEVAPQTLRAALVSLSATGARITATGTPIIMGSVVELGTSVLGETGALQLAGAGAAAIGGGGGIICLLLAATAGAVPDTRAELS